jgi:hypothetical protein
MEGGSERVSRNGERENGKGRSNPSKRHSEQSKSRDRGPTCKRPRTLVASNAWTNRGSMPVKRGTKKYESRSREGEESRREGNERKDGEWGMGRA